MTMDLNGLLVWISMGLNAALFFTAVFLVIRPIRRVNSQQDQILDKEKEILESHEKLRAEVRDRAQTEQHSEKIAAISSPPGLRKMLSKGDDLISFETNPMTREDVLQGPKSEALGPEDPEKAPEGCVLVPIHYATNRQATGVTDPNKYFGGERGDKLRYGSVIASIPDSHELGKLERPSIWKLQFSENPKKFIMLQTLKEMDAGAFFDHLKREVADTEAKSALVFIHGFNVSFAAGARRIAQIAYDLFSEGTEGGKAVMGTVPILYSWPSEGSVKDYIHDQSNADACVPYLKEFLIDVAHRTGAESLTVIAHSMGTRALTSALNEVGLQMQDSGKPLFKEIILAAPDIDKQVFLHLAQAVRRTGENMTIYVSSRDKALLASKAVNGFPRAGDARDGIVVINDSDTIDATCTGDDILAHSYVGAIDVLSDIFNLVTNGLRPAKRFGLTAKGKAPKKYWLMRDRA